MKIKKILEKTDKTYRCITNHGTEFPLCKIINYRYDFYYYTENNKKQSLNTISFLEKLYKKKFVLKHDGEFFTTIKNYGLLEVLCRDILNGIISDDEKILDDLKEKYEEEGLFIRNLDCFD